MRVGVIVDHEVPSDRALNLLCEEFEAAFGQLDPRTDVLVLARGGQGFYVALDAAKFWGVPYEPVGAIDPYYVDELWIFTRRRHIALRLGRDVLAALPRRVDRSTKV